MKNYRKKLDSPDDIQVQTYCKNKNLGVVSLHDVTVVSINVSAGTVNAQIGETMGYKDYPKDELFRYINFFGYCD